MRKGCRAVKKTKRNCYRRQGRQAGRFKNTSGREECTPCSPDLWPLQNVGLRGNPTPGERQCCRYLLSLAFYSFTMPPTPCSPPPLLLCSLLHKNFSPHKVHVWIWSLYSGLLCLHIRLEAGGKEKTPPSLSHLLMSFFFFLFFFTSFLFCWFIFPKSSLTFWHLFSSQNRLFIPELLTKSPQSVCHLVTCPDFMVGKGGLVAVATRRAFIKKVGGGAI